MRILTKTKHPIKPIKHLILSNTFFTHHNTISCLPSLISKFPSLKKTSDNSDPLDINITRNKIFILAGGIGSPQMNSYYSFIQDLSTRFSRVILIPGKHEYYNPNDHNIFTIDQIDTAIKTTLPSQTRSYPIHNVHFLNCNNIQIKDINYIGATLWSSFLPSHEEEMRKKEYKRIYINQNNTPTLLTPHASTKLHYDHIDFIRKSIKTNTKNIIITYHPPIPELYPTNYSIADKPEHVIHNDMKQHMKFTNINMWICGNANFPMKYVHPTSNTMFVANPLFNHSDEQTILEVTI